MPVLLLLTVLRFFQASPVIDPSPLACRIESPSRQQHSPRSGPRSGTASPSCQTVPFLPNVTSFLGSAPTHEFHSRQTQSPLAADPVSGFAEPGNALFLVVPRRAFSTRTCLQTVINVFSNDVSTTLGRLYAYPQSRFGHERIEEFCRE